MQQMATQAQGGPARPQHGKELCLLSLDGGGVRGLSSLCILEELMRKVDPQNPPKPSEYFDLIGGTSTGGLIAIMLGRLQMSIEDCRQAYRELSDEAFQLKNYQAAPAFRAPWNWNLKARFDSAALERGIKRIIVRELRRDPGNDAKSDKELEDTLLRDKQSKCKTFVTATSASMPDRTSILTTYESDRWPRDLLDSVKIWEAARATSAASTFFEPIQVGPDNEKFLDGATGANNPVNVVWDEARDIWQSDSPLEDDVQCVVSIGTGVPSVRAFGGSLLEIGETLKAMATETETTAEAFLRRYTRLHSEERYFRFNVLSGLGDIGLEEAAKRPEIVTATRRYLSSEEPKKNLENCAKNLRFRECMIDLT
ncbi:FabD/lysophospholipase-like protein [Mytilinidion resinicola]|uniref:FabD/lysophospholipase-like protein n=1 Tax=Mytilinidion resinicola TaxID=574789 RepID=A0A6A6Y261_9PEZI|nr:FabD/lysophospholipase-like protein [Mytilinidion resinicola]KAF2802729.1 FabD/lysophospholipase-like protein [Mytilinidion resinicola]